MPSNYGRVATVKVKNRKTGVVRKYNAADFAEWGLGSDWEIVRESHNNDPDATLNTVGIDLESHEKGKEAFVDHAEENIAKAVLESDDVSEDITDQVIDSADNMESGSEDKPRTKKKSKKKSRK